MGEVQEQGFYMCRFCGKSCVSGKSLGGHMRVHLTHISSSKKAREKGKIELESDDHDEQEGGSYHLEGDGDQSNNYELRENPKKSWRISDPKHGLIKNSVSCKECGKEFASLRALSGHMRCHSSKNKKEVHCCKECGRDFDSKRAMFGHMKSHSKRVKVSSVESAESISNLENVCPIRRKRSRIGYKGSVNHSNSSVSELDQAEEAAMCLVMLSMGVGSYSNLDSVTELSDDDSAYFEGVTSYRSKKFCGVYGDQTKIDPEVADELRTDENGTKLEFLCDDHSLMGYEESDKLGVTPESANGDGSVLETLEVMEKKPQHECPICFRVFPSGQALGGHKRAHNNGVAERKNRDISEAETMLDLNFPITVGLSSWLVEHEAFVFTT